MINERRIHKGTGWTVFILTLAVYFRTMAPTASFWDCGEFIACAKTLSIPHPPGAPLFMIIGRIFTMIPGIDAGLSVNLVSVFSGAFTILILYLILIRLIREQYGALKTPLDAVLVFGSAAIGSLSFAVTDSFWFNSVESEVYALSMLFTSLVLWMGMLWMDGHKNFFSARYLLFMIYLFALGCGVHLLNLLVIPTVGIFILFTRPRVLLRGSLWAVVPVVLIVGMSIYLVIYIRAGLNPPINQNDPSTLEYLKMYVNREQYGSTSMFLDIFNRKAPLWEYQIKKMFLRYFSGQFIGKGNTFDSAGYIIENFSLRGLYGIPFAVGFIGFVYHWIKDWKRALSIFVLFIITGIMLNIYLNQPQPQPRERDYVYVGCFFAFSIWIGFGALALGKGIIRLIRQDKRLQFWAAVTMLVVVCMLVPCLLLSFNFHEHDRLGNYIAWDHSYNMLVTCEPNAILFTNGDNDTFPIWYLQEVEGIRRDVRIINLSLLNTSWYIKQLRDNEPKVPVELSDAEIQNIRPLLWPEKRIITFKYNPRTVMSYLREQPEIAKRAAQNPVMNIEVTPTLLGKGIRVQDFMILHIIQHNSWQKPVYFALTIPRSNLIGITKYLRMDGMVYKLVPVENPPIIPDILERNAFEKYQYRGLDNPSVYYNQRTLRLMQNYRAIFFRLISHYYQQQNMRKVISIMDSAYVRVPDDIIPPVNTLYQQELARLYFGGGEKQKARRSLDNALKNPFFTLDDRFSTGGQYFSLLQDIDKACEVMEDIISENAGYERAYSYLINLLDRKQEYRKELYYVEKLLDVIPESQTALDRREQLRQKLNEPTASDSNR